MPGSIPRCRPGLACWLGVKPSPGWLETHIRPSRVSRHRTENPAAWRDETAPAAIREASSNALRRSNFVNIKRVRTVWLGHSRPPESHRPIRRNLLTNVAGRQSNSDIRQNKSYYRHKDEPLSA